MLSRLQDFFKANRAIGCFLAVCFVLLMAVVKRPYQRVYWAGLAVDVALAAAFLAWLFWPVKKDNPDSSNDR
ncbi:hypothetical protein [Bosea sp. LjRoot237]|uniref:hypothetical protein n=1 Tax=Bosea sp. LjRoot237 TaxID=3342292 RepID=UPI003F502F57